MNSLPTISTPIANSYFVRPNSANNDNKSNNSVGGNENNNNGNNIDNSNGFATVNRYGYADNRNNEKSSDNNNNSSESVSKNNENKNNAQNSKLSEAQAKRVLDALKRADAEVKAHEQAHMASGGGLTGGVSYSYKTGPDGKRYAVAGEVSIDTSPGRTPEETKRKAQTIKAAALAPANPSAQDRKVAAMATMMLQQAMAEILKQEQQQSQNEIKKSAEETKTTAENSVNTENNANSKTNNNRQNYDIFANQRRVNQAISAYDGKEVFGA